MLLGTGGFLRAICKNNLQLKGNYSEKKGDLKKKQRFFLKKVHTKV